MIQLTESEGEQYKDCPVVLGFVSGFYVFPVRYLFISSWGS